jgi:hypothetical protein
VRVTEVCARLGIRQSMGRVGSCFERDAVNQSVDTRFIRQGVVEAGRAAHDQTMADLLNGIPRVDPTSKPAMMRRAVPRVLATTRGSAIHRVFIAPLDARLMHMTGGRVHLAKGTIPLV